MSELKYFYREDGKEVGPVGLDLLAKLLDKKLLSPSTEVREDGSDDWQTVSDIFSGSSQFETNAKEEIQTDSESPGEDGGSPIQINQEDAESVPVETESAHETETQTEPEKKHATTPGFFKRRRKSLICAVIVIILAIVTATGAAFIYPLGPREYIYHMQATGSYGPLPLIGEDLNLVERRFRESIQDIFPGGENKAYSIGGDQARQLVFFENQKVAAVITYTEENGADTLADFKSVAEKSSQVIDIDDQTFWVEPEDYAARLKSDHSFIYATERGLELIAAADGGAIE